MESLEWVHNRFYRWYCSAYHPPLENAWIMINGAEIWLTWRNIYELMTTLKSWESVNTK